MKYTLVNLSLLLSFSLFGQNKLDADQIIADCIDVHGGSDYDNAHFSYDFRKYQYEFHYHDGSYTYTRYLPETGMKDVLTNDDYTRWDNGQIVNISKKKARSYANSVNSVHYFAFLPFFLNDQAVNKKLIGSTIIKGKEYYVVEVTFDQNGGGDDHDDIYVYWINQEKMTMDYLAYSFHVNGGGVRFREAYNRRQIGGIVFQDYINYKHDRSTDVRNMGRLFNKDQLVELSKIEMKNIREIGKK